jgi:hypothetical protein
MKHYVVALDEHGNSIKNMDLATTDGEPRESTDDWSEATSVCGMLNHYEAGKVINDRMVGGYEVVSEE